MNNRATSMLDREIVILASIWDLIGSMVHYAHFEKGHRTQEATLMFRNGEASKLFLIILADFLSLPRSGTLGLPTPTGEGSLASTYLGLLDVVAAEPQLGGDPVLLAEPLGAFAAWLDAYAVVDEVWLPSIDRNAPIKVRRMTFLKICGTISKHGITRLGDVVGKIQKLLAENGTDIDEGQAYLVVPEFQEWFQDHVFAYHTTSIACFLNNIRWGIFDYLRPEFRRSYRPTRHPLGVQMYTYDVPQKITDTLIRSMYWDLMNNVRAEPYFPRFTVSPYLVQRY